MGKALDAVAVVFLKKQARALVTKIREAEDAYDCGVHLLHHIRPDVMSMKRVVNSLFDQLALIDPETPKYRYPVDAPKEAAPA